MPTPDKPEIPSAITNEPQSNAMEPPSVEQTVHKVTHDVDSDDMFDPQSG